MRALAVKIRHADIAAAAGVSIATVDRVLNGRPGVAARTSERIRQAVRRLESRGDRGRPASSAAPLVVDVILPAGPNTFMGMLQTAIEAEALRSRAVAARCHRVEGFDPEILAARIRDVGAASEGLAVVALENPVVREAIHDVVDRGIPVVTLVSNLTGARKLGYVGLDNRSAGRTAGYLLHRFVHAGAGEVAMLEGSLSLSYRDHQERELGFRDALREYAPGLEIVGRRETQDDFEQAYRQTHALLDAYPALLGLYSIGSGVRGIAHALTERGRGDVVFIAHDLTRYTRQYLIDGTVDAVLHQSPETLARLALSTLAAARSGDAPAPPDPLGVTVYFRDNLP